MYAALITAQTLIAVLTSLSVDAEGACRYE